MATGSSEIVPKGRMIEVRFAISLPETATRDDVMEWIRDAVGAGGGVRLSNPLIDESLEALQEPVLTDTGMVVEEIVTRISGEEGGAVFQRTVAIRPDRRKAEEVASWRNGRDKLELLMHGDGTS